MSTRKPAKNHVVWIEFEPPLGSRLGRTTEHFRLTGKRRPCSVPGHPYEVELDVDETRADIRWVVVASLRGMEGLDLQFEDVPEAEAA